MQSDPRMAFPARVPSRDLVAGIVAIAGGLAIAWADSRPGWDATGITVVALIAVACVAAFVSQRRPWLWAVLAGLWVPLLELPGSGPAPLAALVIAAVGAVAGWLVARSSVAP